MKIFLFLQLLLLFSIKSYAVNYFIAVDGNDANCGSIDAPFASLSKAQSLVTAGDTVYIRGGIYKLRTDQIMTDYSIWSYVFDMQRSGINEKKRICYWGYKDERPVFDLSDVKPEDKRIIAFYVRGSFLHFKNFEIVGTQVTILTHTQSECFRNDGGNNNIYEHIAMHDGKAIGFYLVRGSDNLVLNCDAYNNYDDVSGDGRGGNVDGFGGHANASSTGNVFRGCRAWYNSDDGFDLINCQAAYRIENCWSFYNGYKPNSFTTAGDGSGFKSGGYGMSDTPKVPDEIPMHVVQNCLAYYNKNQGFYANHHLGGIAWYNNTAYQNPSNFNMLSRKSAEEAVDVDGYGHIIKNNLSFEPRISGRHIINVDQSVCDISHNSFLPIALNLNSEHFYSLDPEQLMWPRQTDGCLPEINFMRPRLGSSLINAGTNIGLPFNGRAPDIGCFENYDYAMSIPRSNEEQPIVWSENGAIHVLMSKHAIASISTLTGWSKTFQFVPGNNIIIVDEGVHLIHINGYVNKVYVRR